MKIGLSGKYSHGVRKAFIKNRRLSLGARFLIWVLMAYKGSDDYCYPSLHCLGLVCGVHRSTIKRWIKELKCSGYLKTKPRGFKKTLLFFPSYTPKYKARLGDTQNSLNTGAVVNPLGVNKNLGPNGSVVVPSMVPWRSPTHSFIDLKKREIKNLGNSEETFRAKEKLRAKVAEIRSKQSQNAIPG